MRFELFALTVCAILLGRAATLQAAGLSATWVNVFGIVSNLAVGVYFARCLLRRMQRTDASRQLQPLEQLLQRGDMVTVVAQFEHDDDALPGTWRCRIQTVTREDSHSAPQPPDA